MKADHVYIITEHMDLCHEFREAKGPLTTDQAIELQKVEALENLADSIQSSMLELAEAIKNINI